MNVKNILICFLLLSSVVYGCRNSNNNAKDDKQRSGIFINQPSINWGTVAFEDTVKIMTVCYNFTDHDIFIDYINTPCGCITALPRSEIIHKQDSVIIDIKYKPMETGYVEKNMFIYFKNIRDPIHFVIKGKIKEP
jgi:hypothetical protein